MSKMVKAKCTLCGKIFLKKELEVHKHNFCNFNHFKIWNSRRISEYNQKLNPMNKPGGVLSARIKSGNKQRGRGDGKTYIKFLGRHLHRVVAEKMIGRDLKPGEVVHHLDGNIRNNCPENLMVLKSQSEHAKIHFSKEIGGGANEHF